MKAIDLNSDLGEGAGTDAAIMPFITSANIACGAHAGDPETMRATVALAIKHRVAIGAHPGYRDPANFGRVPLDLPRSALFADLVAQIEALRAIAHDQDARVTHVKAHGALYNRGERDPEVAAIIVDAVRTVGADLVLFAPPGSAMEAAARALGVRVAREGFADRAYEPDGTLRSRKLAGAVHSDPDLAAGQAMWLAGFGKIPVGGESVLPYEVDTICVHGDTPNAPAIVARVRAALESSGVTIRSVAARTSSAGPIAPSGE